MRGEERLSKWKSTLKRANPNPVYKESCELDLTATRLSEEDIEIHVLVMRSDLSQHSEVALVKFGGDVGRSGESHWREAHSNPDQTFAGWHPLFPPPYTQLIPTRSYRSSTRRSRSPSPSRLPAKVLKPMLGMQL